MMKKIIFSLLTLIAMSGRVMAGDKPIITVADVEALPGETVSFTVNLTDGKASTYTAMTLYAYFPTTGFTTTGAYTVSNLWTGASGFVGDINTSMGLATIPFASANAIQGATVDNLVTVSFTVDNSVAVGEYSVTLKRTMFEYNTSDKDYADDVTFKVKVVNIHTIVLDELSTEVPAAHNGVNVMVKRTIKANEWSTICLPLAISSAQVKEAFGDDVKIANFTGYEATTDKNDNVTGINVNFAEVDAIEANHPYVIKVSSAISEFTVDNVDIDPEDEPKVATVVRTKKRWSEIIGTYVANTTIENQMLFLNGNKFWYSNGSTKMKGYRAYFDFYDVLSEVENASAKITFFDGTTEISNVNINDNVNEEAPRYNLAGQKVSKSYKGIVILNGVKRVIK